MGYRTYKRYRAWDFNEYKGYSNKIKGIVLGFLIKIFKRSISFFFFSSNINLNTITYYYSYNPYRTYSCEYNGFKNPV